MDLLKSLPLRWGVSKLAAAMLVSGLIVCLAACGASAPSRAQHGSAGSAGQVAGIPQAHPQVVEPTAGQQGSVVQAQDPVGDPHAHAPPLSQVRQELRLELVAVSKTNSTYINPLYYVTCCGRWERTDQGVDASLPVGAPILAPGRVKVLDIEPNWYAGQPLVYWELLDGPDAGQVQYVAEQITSIVPPGTYLSQGQAICRFAPSGTGIEFGWSTLNGVTLAMATSGYEEGQVTPAGVSIREWLNALGAKAGSG